MVTLHGLKACDTCKKALKSLLAEGQEAQLRDLRAQPVSAEEIRLWHAQFGGKLLNTRSTTWRGLTEAEREGDPVELMTAHPVLVKRPVVETADGLHLGWTPETRAALGLPG